MLDRIIAPLAGLIVATISSLGYGGVVLLMAIESACVPLPVRDHHAVLRDIWSSPAPLQPLPGRHPPAPSLQCRIHIRLCRRLLRRQALRGWRWGHISPDEPARSRHRGTASSSASAASRCSWARLLPVIRTFIALPAGGRADAAAAISKIYTFLGSWPGGGFRPPPMSVPSSVSAGTPTRSCAISCTGSTPSSSRFLPSAAIWYVRRHWKNRSPAATLARIISSDDEPPPAFPSRCSAAAGVVVGSALPVAIFRGLQPCELCLAERWPYYHRHGAETLLALLAGHRRLTEAVLALSGIVFLASAGPRRLPRRCRAALDRRPHRVRRRRHRRRQEHRGPAEASAAAAARPLRLDPMVLFGVSLAGWKPRSLHLMLLGVYLGASCGRSA